MRNKLFATAKEVVSFFGFVVVLFLFVAAAGNGALSASTTPQISAGLQTSPPPFSPTLRGTDGCPPLAGVGGGYPGRCPEHFDSNSRIEPATGKSVCWVERSETQQSSNASTSLSMTSFRAESRIQNLSSTSIGDPQLDKAAFAQKTKKLQIPFIANDGQTDERVRFYANTFGGTVFVTKEGEIVYSLPKPEETEGRSQKAEAGIQDHRESCIVDRASVEGRTSDIVHPASWIVDHDSKSEFQNPKLTSSDSKNLKSSNSKSAIQNLYSTSIGDLKSGVAIKETLVGGRVQEITGNEKAVTKVSYFKGNDPSQWKSDISTYDVVSLGEVYDGIELKLKAYGDNVEKLFCVKSGANPEQIKISLSGIQPSENPPPLSPSVRGTGGCPPLAGAGGGLGARGLWVNEHGELEVATELGPVKFTKPIAYQEIDGKRVGVTVEYRVESLECGVKNSKLEIKQQNSRIPNSQTHNSPTPQLIYRFKVASYDRTKDLIIDPLLASTFLGGSGGEQGYSLTLDASGDVYVTGQTQSTNFPTTSGAYDASQNGSYDVFVSKLNGSLTSMLASTYLGGSNTDQGFSLALDTSGNVYVTGMTQSTDFPTTSGAYDASQNGSYEVFVSKLNGSLTSLLASTYLGGSGDDEVGLGSHCLTLDASGNVYVTGWTASTNFPTTSGAYDASQNGSYDVFVSELNGSLTSMLASTFLGGAGFEEGRSLTLDTSGNVYMTGMTQSTDFPTTSGAYDASQNGSNEVFVSKLNGSLTSLLASTFLGGAGVEDAYSLTLDTSGNVYMTGVTGSANFPTTSGAYDASQNGSYDVFVSKLNSGLTSLVASTYLGGSSDEQGWALTLDTSGNVYVTGWTASTNFPTTSGAYDASQNGSSDVFVSKLDGNLSASTVTPTPTPSPTPTPTQECVQPPSDMVAWWPLDETQGSTANDFAGSFNNDGTWTGSPGTVTGKVAGALSFNGSNYVEVGPAQTEINFQTNEDFSIDVWVQTVGSQSTRTLVDKRTENPQGNVIRGYHLYLYNGKPGLQLADGSYTNYNSTASTAFVADGNWHHIAVTVDRNNTSGLNIYVDGSSTASLDPTARAGNLTNSAPLVFGGKNLITPSFTFVGILDELELFNRALTQTEIQDIYNAGSAGKCKPASSPTPTPTTSPVGTGTVIGWVEDEDEEPLEGVTVTIKGEFSDSTKTDEDGYYEFGGLPKGNYTITYKKEGYQTQTQDVSLNEGEEKDLDITTLEQIVTGEIFGNVVDNINGNPLESVSLNLKGKKTKVIQTTSSDVDGFFEFADLEADTYVITATIKGYKSAKQTITLQKGEDREIEFKLKKKSKKIIKGSVR